MANAQAETLQAHYQYVWSVRYIDAAILRDENTDTDGLCDDGRIYYLTDANFNVTALIDATGSVVERYVYTPYGEVTVYNADWSATRDASAVDNTHLYTGRDLDAATGLYYYRARWYDAGQGNFLQRDPLGFAAGDANLYRYCGGSPTGSVDPSGLLADGNHHSGGSSDGQVWRGQEQGSPLWAGTKAGMYEFFVVGLPAVARSFKSSLEEAGRFGVDFAGVGVETIGHTSGWWEIRYNERSQIFRATAVDNPNRYAASEQAAGRIGLGTVTLGTSEFVFAGMDYQDTGDASRFRDHVG
ncbi:MAG: RHS repeat-associated core domain-containing protein, partial [Patescibacteria group bacterium]|nr:RHS repeat-associated core domain-containing protein [Patescibacteria group bacterium]